jgi:shikimate dehydrogenase
MEVKHLFGLVGRNIGHSFSKKYFTDKFSAAGLKGYAYENFDLPQIGSLPRIIKGNPCLKGLNVTIPYKEAVIPFLHSLSEDAATIGAVNTIRVEAGGNLAGFNTDHFGFRRSVETLLQPHHRNALILGTGGAAKAVAFALKDLGIGYRFASRGVAEGVIRYADIDARTFENFEIFINCTPVGTSPFVDQAPHIPYECFTHGHLAYDLIYNPAETLFLSNAGRHGAQIKNGYDMLVFQAEKAWQIWQPALL